jgi:hypothetical protein
MVAVMARKKGLSDAARAMGQKGGKTRAKRLTPEERREIARKAARARWGNKRG